MQTSKHLLLALLLALLPQSQGQTYSSCDPTKKTCPPNPGMKTGTWSANLASSKGLPAGVSQMKSQGTINYASSGAEFVVEKPKDSPTIITDSYFFFGYAEARMKASAGVGIVSSFVLESDDLDEVDWVCLYDM
jgi:hypothetical protein